MDGDGYISNGELFQVLKMMVGSNLKDTQLQQIVDKTILFADKVRNYKSVLRLTSHFYVLVLYHDTLINVDFYFRMKTAKSILKNFVRLLEIQISTRRWLSMYNFELVVSSWVFRQFKDLTSSLPKIEISPSNHESPANFTCSFYPMWKVANQCCLKII